MNSTSLEALRTRLDPKTQEWLRANPGSVIIPRSVTEALLRASDQQEPLEGVDLHDQLRLSPLDRNFIKSVAVSSPVDHPVPSDRPEGYGHVPGHPVAKDAPGLRDSVGWVEMRRW